MHSANGILSDEVVHAAASRLRETLGTFAGAASAQQLADMDTILAWIMRQTELTETYRRPEAGPAGHQG